MKLYKVNKLGILLVLLIISTASKAQDIIVKNDKTEIKSKVLELTEEVIKYKKFEMLEGPTYSINKAEVFMVLYANGTKEYIDHKPIPKTTPSATPEQQDTNTDTTADMLEPGIYYFNPINNHYLEIDGSNITSSKSGGLGESILRNSISGLFNAKERVTLGGVHSAIAVNCDTPVFLFVIDLAQKGFNNNTSYLGKVSSPNDFFLVKLKEKKDSREIVVGKSNNVSSSQGIDDKQKIAFKYQKIKKGFYKVVTESKLEKGEYCFMFASASLYEGVVRKVFDFSVQ